MTDFLIKDETPGRLNALVKEIGGLKVMDGILKGTLRFEIVEQSLFASVAEITIPATKGVDPSQYFQTREGLYVWPEFRNRIVSVAKKTELPEITLQSFALVKAANDTEIRSDLPEDHVLEASEFCAIFPEILSRQPGGEEGFLLNNGYANVFYVRGKSGGVFAVRVFWYSVSREWGVGAGRLGDFRWGEGRRVFSRATA